MEDTTTEFYTTEAAEFYTGVTSEATIFNNDISIYYVNIETLQNYTGFIIGEVLMTSLVLLISLTANFKIPSWRRNYRNQMLLQLSIARFLKRALLLASVILHPDTYKLKCLLRALQVYSDFVIIILVLFFIKHMYDSIIVVIVNVNKIDLYKVAAFSWSIPVLLSASYTLATYYFEEWTTYLIMCGLCRWPVMFIGTAFYLFILYKVISDKIREYALSLTVITFFLCLIINLYLFSEDLLILYCPSKYTFLLINYFIMGLMLNSLILCFYVVLLMKTFKYDLCTFRKYSEPDVQYLST